MDSFEFNKIIGAVLFSVLALLGLANLASSLYSPHELEQQAYIVEGVMEEGQEGAAAAPAEEGPTLAELLASADPAAGAKVFVKCQSCHSIEQGGGNKIGPNLYGAFGAVKAHRDDFAYSDAMKAKEGIWDWDALDHFLAKPSDYVPGTAMSFAGLRKEKDRANLMVYLASMSPNDLPLPAIEADAETAVEDAAADVEGAVEGAAEEAGNAAEEAADAVEGAVEDAAGEMAE